MSELTTVISTGAGIATGGVSAIGAAASLAINNVTSFLKKLGAKTPHISWDQCNQIVHSIVDSWCSCAIAQCKDENERRILAAIAVQELDQSFYKTYQTNVENLSGVRLTWLYDNWKEATGQPVGMWDLNQLAATIGSHGTSISMMFVNSVWRVGMLAFTNLSTDASTYEATIPNRTQSVLDWYCQTVQKFSNRIGRTINPVPVSTLQQLTSSNVNVQQAVTPEQTEEYIRSADLTETLSPKQVQTVSVIDTQTQKAGMSPLIMILLIGAGVGLIYSMSKGR